MLKGIYNLTKDMRQTCKTHTKTQAGGWEALNEKTKAIRVLMRKTVMGVKGFLKEIGLRVGFRSLTGLQRERGEGGEERRGGSREEGGHP